MANRCSEPILYLLQHDKLSSLHCLQALLRVHPFQYRTKRQPRYFPNGMQYSTETIPDFVFRGKGNWKLGWISHFDLASTCTYGVANLKRPNLKSQWFSLVTGRECYIFDMKITVMSPASTMHNKAVFDDTHKKITNPTACSLWCKWSPCKHFWLITFKHIWHLLCSLFAFSKPNWMSLPLPYQVFKLQFESYDCTQSWIHLPKWLDSEVQPYAHTFIAPRLSMCSTFNRPPGYTIWVMLKDILLSFVSLSFFSLFFFLMCCLAKWWCR